MAYDPVRDLYEIVGVPPDARWEDIQAAVRSQLAQLREGGPDKRARAVDLRDALGTLSDPARRAAYDRERTAYLSRKGRGGHQVSALDAECPPIEQPEPGVSFTHYWAPTAEAVRAVEQNLARDPNNADLLSWLAFMYYSSQRNDEAIATYQKLIAINGRDARSIYYMGNSLWRKGRREEAIAQWRAVIQQDPEGQFAKRAKKKLEQAGCT